MRPLAIFFTVVFLTACSTLKVAVVPVVNEDFGNSPTVVTGVVQSASIKPNYTFRENYLQPTPWTTKRGFKGSLIISITSVDRGHFSQASLKINRARFTNPHQLADAVIGGAMRPGAQVRVAFVKNDPAMILPLAINDWPADHRPQLTSENRDGN